MKRLVGICVAFIIMFGIGSNVQAANFTPRTSAPSSNDYHYFSDNIFYKSGIGMPNCTAYAWGRAYELLGSKPRLSTGNAGKWWNYNINNGYYSYGSEPKLGAIACWDHYDNNTGHVAVVEAINGNDITISESNYGGVYWRMVTIPKNGVYGSLHFQGYIYIGDFGGETPVDLGDSFYAVILHRDSWKPIEVCDDNFVKLGKENGYANQVWKFKRESDGCYTIASVLNKKLLEVFCGVTDNGNPTAAASEDWGGYYQRWYIYQYDNGYVIKSKHYTDLNRVLDMPSNNTADGTPVTTFERNNSRAQIFAIYKGDDVQLKPATLSANVNESDSTVTFDWNEVYGESRYDVKIWKDKVYQGDAYHIEWGAGHNYSINLPPGYYEAYVDAANEFECKMSNVVGFTVPEPPAPPTPTPKEPEIPIKTRVITKTATENLSLVHTVYAELENLAARDIGCDVIFVYKYADGSIAKTDVQTVTVPAKQTLNAESSVSNKIIDLGGNLVNSVEVYVWNSADGMIPFAEKKIGSFDYDY